MVFDLLFCSLDYLLFLPATVILYWCLPHRLRLPMLLIASYLFYMSWNSQMVLLIIAMTVFNFFYGFLLAKAQAKKKLIFGLGLAANIACLAYFKYANFFVDSLTAFWRLTGQHADKVVLNIILPLGISFFVFEFIHYLFEIYRGKKPLDSFVLFGLFAAFFPTQIAGPIKRYDDFSKQMEEEKHLRLSYFDEGIPLIVIGMAKKVLIASNLAIIVDMMAQTINSYGALELWIFCYAFVFQVFFDFSAYTDIARGSSLLFGYRIPINFNLPFISSNISELWQRWHISLSSWLKDYCFQPFGGTKRKKWSMERALLLTMTIGGLWHGASWNFVVWGFLWGLSLVVHRYFRRIKSKLPQLNPVWQSKAFNYFSIFLTVSVFAGSSVFFRLPDFKPAVIALKKMLLFSPLLSPGAEHGFIVMNSNLPIVVPLALMMLAALTLLIVPVSFMLENGAFKKVPVPLKASYLVALVVLMLILLPNNSTPFVYFQF